MPSACRLSAFAARVIAGEALLIYKLRLAYQHVRVADEEVFASRQALPSSARPPAPRWELTSCKWTYSGRPQREDLLRDGWEPFAVGIDTMWFRRPVR